MGQVIHIPAPLRKVTGGRAVIEANAASIGDLLSEVESRYPGMREQLRDETGALRRYINLYVNQEDIRFLQNQQTRLKDGDEISIIPAIAGG